MADREHEAVAVRPDRIGGVEAQEPPVPQRVADRRQAHRRAGMAGIGLAAPHPSASVRIVLMQSWSMSSATG